MDNRTDGQTMVNVGEVWESVLGELRLQMTKDTFAWLRTTRAVALEDDELVVEVENERAREWLAHRLVVPVERTVASVVGRAVTVRFVVREVLRQAQDAEGEDKTLTIRTGDEGERRGFVAPAIDMKAASAGGWFPVTGYASRFWAPFLGRVAWRTWEIVRREDKRKRKDEWTPRRRFSAPMLGLMVPCGVQAIVGVWRRCEEGREGAVEGEDGVWRKWQRGAFDRLREAGVASVEARGEWRHRTYLVCVLVTLPFLRPEQVGGLPVRLQLQHERWLEEQGLDPRRWDLPGGNGARRIGR